MTTENKRADEAAWIKELATILDDTGLSEIEIERDGFRVRVSRSASHIAQWAPPPVSHEPVNAAVLGAANAGPNAVPLGNDAARAEAPVNAVTSPMVGTIYLASAPGADPFITVGSRVTTGQTLMIVEAMKTMNPIQAPSDGVVKSILVDDAQPVEFGEALVIVE